ncbi:MAG: DUF2878 family protein [Nitrospira sp. CR1.3]|nr:DUF2878 family protein [Nitrospira sp. CR1.3]
MVSRLRNFASFQVGWFSCVLGAANHRPWLGPIVVLALLTAHLWNREDRWEELRLILAVGLLGFLVDSLLGYAGILVFRDSVITEWLCPPWLLALWLNFATVLRNSLGWLVRRYSLAAPLGGIFGPVSYYAGQEFGALRLGVSLPVVATVLSVLWALLVPLLLWWGADERE